MSDLDTRDALWRPVMSVLWNASNYPVRVQPHVLGEDMGPLADRVTDAVLTKFLAAHDAETVRVTAEKAAQIGFVVLSKRPDIHRPGEFDYQPAGSVWPTIEPCENHRAYCQMSAESRWGRYGDVEYVIGRIGLAPDEPAPELFPGTYAALDRLTIRPQPTEETPV